MKIFVTGGTGFIGSHLIDHLLGQEDAEIYALARNPDKARWRKDSERVHFLKGDLLSIPPLPADIDVVFHLAGITKALKSEEYYTVNQKGTASLFQNLLSLKPAPRVLHLSSLAAAGPSLSGEPLKEEEPPHPVSEYGKSKLAGEVEAMKHRDRLHVTIFRVGGVFGPRDEDFLKYFRLVKKGILLHFGPPGKSLSLCHVRDLARAMALWSGAQLEKGQIFHIADPKVYTWVDFGKSAARIMGKKARPLRVPSWLAYAVCWASGSLAVLTGKPTPLSPEKFKEMKQVSWLMDTRKAKNLLSFETRVSLDEGLRETIAWYRDTGWL